MTKKHEAASWWQRSVWSLTAGVALCALVGAMLMLVSSYDMPIENDVSHNATTPSVSPDAVDVPPPLTRERRCLTAVAGSEVTEVLVPPLPDELTWTELDAIDIEKARLGWNILNVRTHRGGFDYIIDTPERLSGRAWSATYEHPRMDFDGLESYVHSHYASRGWGRSYSSGPYVFSGSAAAHPTSGSGSVGFLKVEGEALRVVDVTTQKHHLYQYSEEDDRYVSDGVASSTYVVYVSDTISVRSIVDIDAVVPYFGFAYESDETDRIVVEEVSPNSPAAVAGLRTGDILLSLDDANITSKTFEEIKSLYCAGETVSVQLLRGREKVNLVLKLGNMFE